MSEETKKKKPKKKKTHKGMHIALSSLGNIFLVLLVAVLIGSIFICDYVLGYIYDVPAVKTENILGRLTENSVIVDENGNLLETIYGNSGIRTRTVYDDISQNMIRAIVSIEDKTFFEHSGFNYVRLAGSVVQSIKSGARARGTSSITQQLAKNLYLTKETTLERKIKEAYYAILLERSLSKKLILEGYLNKINLGLKLNGVEAASTFYFSKKAKDLNLIEAAIIAGIPKSPNKYAPVKRIKKEDIKPTDIVFDDSDYQYAYVFNKKAQDRFDFVIQQMQDNGLLTGNEYALKGTDISKYINITSEQANSITSYFGDMIKDDVVSIIAKNKNLSKEDALEQLYNGGYQIYSTIDYSIQQQLEAIYNAIDFSNVFDNATYNAVRTFQAHNKLEKDGVAGKNTLKTLCEQTSYEVTDFSKSFYKKGHVNDDVITLKKALHELGLMSNDGLFPRAAVLFDKDHNILYEESNKVLLYKYDNIINNKKELIIKNDAYYFDDKKNLIILKNHGLKFYQHNDRVQVVVDKLFRYNEESAQASYSNHKKYYNISDFYIYTGKDVLIPDEYKKKVDGNLVIDASFMKDYPDFFTFDENKNIHIAEKNYVINKRGEIQPQSAFVILDNKTGHIKAIIGGRESYGKNIYNRALHPQQPGSSMKPIGPYTVAIKSGQFTAASVIDDVPTYKNAARTERWPYNWYEYSKFKYKGRMNLRQGIEYSINVLAVKLAEAVGFENVANQLEELGITTIVREGNVNDLNPSAMALGGMSQGIKPLELAAAYATYANHGVYTKPISFTKITDFSGNIIYENTPEKKRVLSEQVAYIIQDMMVSAVTTGVSNKANFKTMPIAGKTGTTSDKRDALFVGYTPYYTGAVWFGCDVKVKMDHGSESAANFWSVVMKKLHKDKERIEFVRPEGIQNVYVDRVSGKRPGALSALDPQGSQVYSELFIPGTAPTEVDDAHVEVMVCGDNEKHVLATEYCPNAKKVVLRTRLEDYFSEAEKNGEKEPILTKDYIYTVPYTTCKLHDAKTLEETSGSNPVLKTKEDGSFIFIRDYNLLLKNGEFKFIPKDSEVFLDNSILLTTGDIIEAEEYNFSYITNPSEQMKAIYEKSLEKSENNEENNTDNNE